MSFLDVNIRNETDAFSTSTYRKPTFTGLSTKISSAINPSYKLTSVKCLINRAYNFISKTSVENWID